MGFGSNIMIKSQFPRWCFSTKDYNELKKIKTIPCIDCQNNFLRTNDSVVNCSLCCELIRKKILKSLKV